MKPDPNRVLMSDTLKGQVPELEDEQVDELQNMHVTVIAGRTIAGKQDPMVGLLRGVHLGTEPEIEFRCEITAALEIIDCNNLSFSGFELHHGTTRVIKIPGPFIVKAARIDEISAQDQLCTLGLHLTKQPR